MEIRKNVTDERTGVGARDTYVSKYSGLWNGRKTGVGAHGTGAQCRKGWVLGFGWVAIGFSNIWTQIRPRCTCPDCLVISWKQK